MLTIPAFCGIDAGFIYEDGDLIPTRQIPRQTIEIGIDEIAVANIQHHRRGGNRTTSVLGLPVISARTGDLLYYGRTADARTAIKAVESAV